MPDYRLEAHPLRPLKLDLNPLQQQAAEILAYNYSQLPAKEEKGFAPAEHTVLAEKLESFVKNNFKQIDDNGDKFLSRAELKLFALDSRLTQEDRRIANLIVSNYDDFNGLTDFSKDGYRWERLNPKTKPELTLNDFQLLRTCTKATAFQQAIELKQNEGKYLDYILPCSYGGLTGLTIATPFALVAAGLGCKKLAGAIMLTGLAGGIIVGARSTSHHRENTYKPGCQNYYDKKKELSASLLDRMK